MARFLMVVALLTVLGLTSAEECQKSPEHLKPGHIARSASEPLGGMMCPKTGFFEEIFWQCEHRFCCETPCDCTTTHLLEESDTCNRNDTRFCFVQQKRRVTFKMVCCEGYKEDPVTRICTASLPDIPSTTTTTTATTEPTTVEQTTSKNPNVVGLPRDAAVVKYVPIPVPIIIVIPLVGLILLLLIIIGLLLLRRCRRKKAAQAAGVENPAFDNVTYDAARGAAVAPPLPVKIPFVGEDGKDSAVCFVEPDGEKKGFPDDLPTAAVLDPPPPYTVEDKHAKAMKEENPYDEVGPLPEKVKAPGSDKLPISSFEKDATPIPPKAGADGHTYANDVAGIPGRGNLQDNVPGYNNADRDNLLNEGTEEIYEEIRN